MLNEVVIVFLMLLSQISPAPNNAGLISSEQSGQVKGDSIVLSFKDFFRQTVLMNSVPRKVKNADLSIQAKSFYVMDEKTDYTLSEKDSQAKMPIASLTKIMTAILVLENTDLNDTVKISSNAVATFGNKRGLVVGEEIRVEDLLKIMLVDSNNAAAVALAEHTGGSVEKFVALMNQKAKDLKLINTRFINPTGLDEGDNYNYSNAYEIALLTDYALEKQILWNFSSTKEATVYSLNKKQVHNVKNTDDLLGEMNGIVGGKTGYTEKAGECLVLIVQSPDKRGRVVAVILNSEDRFGEMKSLINWTFEVFKW
jgi:D-alanyl-D-alanine carboxypeptidase (penicillin-binding protein 5/6)